MEKLIITAAITGGRITREMTPYIPVTPEEIVQSAYECWQAGAAIAHIHVRDPQTGLGTQDVAVFRQGVDPLREKTDLILTLTPHIVRNPDITEEDLAPIWVGTENRITIFGNSPRVRSPATASPSTWWSSWTTTAASS